MRFLVFGLLFLTAVYVSESHSLAKRAADPSKDDLKKDVDNLKKQAEDAIKKLEDEGKTLVANEVKKMEGRLVVVESDLEKLNPSTDAGKALLNTLETIVKDVEKKLEAEFKKINGGYYAEPTREDIVKAVGEFVDKADKSIVDLSKTGKTALIEGLEKTIKFLEDDLLKKLPQLKPTTEVGKVILEGVATLTKEVVADLASDLKKAQAGTAITDSGKDRIMKLVEGLLDNASKAMLTLSKTSKTELVDGLEKTIKLVEEIGSDLKVLAPTTDTGKALLGGLQAMIQMGETVLKADLAKAKGSYYADPTKEEVVKEVEAFVDKATKSIQDLSKSTKKELIDGLEKTIKFLQEEVLNKLTQFKPTTEIGKVILQGVAKLAKEVETALAADLKKAQAGTAITGSAKDQIMKLVQELLDNTEKAVETLGKSSKTELVDGLQKTIKLVEEIGSDLKVLAPVTETGKALLGALEKLIQLGDVVLKADLKKAQGL